MDAAITALLLAHAPLTDLLSARIHWLRLPEGKAPTPFVILQEVSEREPSHLEGATGLMFTRLQVDCWSELKAEAGAVATAIDDLLNGLAVTQGDTRFHRITKMAKRDLGPVDDDGRRVLIRLSMDFECVWSKET